MFIFVVKPLGTCRGWGSSRSVALLSAPPEAQCAAPGGPHPVAPQGAGAEGGEGTSSGSVWDGFWVRTRTAVCLLVTPGLECRGTHDTWSFSFLFSLLITLKKFTSGTVLASDRRS
ncbi:unnamed protein product [Pleuronectes platessa]|uniref:Uncharacterized protein n=1 Tax=Pleuronectes platessa TaxID=8262 RepID=A0A9N7W542_PLEPL|nr:unnamed protein product [Pleuronectes platessa]